MGRERGRTRQLIFLCLAGVNLFFFLSCASISKLISPPPETPAGKIPVKEPLSPADKSIEQANKLLRHGQFEASMKENERALSLAGRKPPGDKALFNMGLIYAHDRNPQKDYEKSIYYLNMMIKDYPWSPLAEEARIYVHLLQENKELTEQIKKLTKNYKKSEFEKKTPDKLRHANELFNKGDYEGSLKENQRVLSLSGPTIPRDRALFNLGLIFAYGENPNKDYGKSIFYFNKLMADYPESPLIPEAKAWVKMLQENKQLIEMINKVKEVDIAVEEKKRGKEK
ncbi:MAG: tetratricopeptide repeat protein [Thermodesulfobacteriota bacterium]